MALRKLHLLLARNIHSIRIHALADIEVVVLEVRNNLLRIRRGARLKLLDRIVAGAILLERGLHLLHVLLEMSEIRLLVEWHGRKAE